MKGCKKLLFIITLVFVAVLLTACAGGGEGTPHTVTFVTNEGAAIQTAVVSRIDESPITSRTNYRLAGWYLDEELTNKVTFPYTVTKETALYAKWQQVFYVVFSIDNVERYRFPYASGEVVERFSLAENEVKGYTFNGWDTAIPDIMPEKDVYITGTLTPKTFFICFDNTANDVTISGTTTAYTTKYDKKETVFPAIPVTYGTTFQSALSAVKATRTDGFDFDKWTRYELGTGYVDFSVGRNDLWEEDGNILLTPQWAETGTVGLNFELNEEGDAYFVSNYDRDGSFVRIPYQYRKTDNEEYKPVTAIGANAFNGNTTLNEIGFSKNDKGGYNITTIERMAFAGATQLRKIEIPVSVTTIGDRAFEACVSLTEISIPSNVEAVSNSMFADCTALEKVTLTGGKLAKIGEYAFFGANKLKEIVIPKSVTSIGNFAFQNTVNMAVITFHTDANIKTIGAGTFKGSGITGIDIPSSVDAIGEEAFADCTHLQRITLPASVKSIGNKAFAGAIRLERAVVPSSVTQIGDKIFLNCEGLISINLGAQSKLSGWSVDWDVKYDSMPPVRFGSEHLHWGSV
ncbi:MAG: leucine-rich repeat domain-containing protein [Clostridia bacterium]